VSSCLMDRVAGNFIFFMRADDPDRRFLVLRKALYAYQIKKSGGSVELVHSQRSSRICSATMAYDSLLSRIVLPSILNRRKWLRDFLKTPSFKELGRFPLGGNDLYPPNSSLVLYENLKWAPPEGSICALRC